MTEKKVSQSQHDMGLESPWSALWGTNWQPLVEAQMERMGAFAEELERLRAEGVSHAQTVIDEATRFTKQTLSYSTQLSQVWSKMALDAVRRSTDAMQNKGA